VRIGIDASSLPMNVAGAGTYMCGLVRALAQVDHTNEYLLFVRSGTQNLFGTLLRQAGNFKLMALPNLARPPRLLWQHLGAGRQTRSHHLDVWHGLHYSLPFFTGATRTVSTFHDVAFFLYPQLYAPVKRFYFQQTIRSSLQKADAIISVSQATADDVKARLMNGKSPAPEAKLHVVHSGVDPKFFSSVPVAEVERVRQQYSLTAPYILFLGTLEKRKNLPLLIEAFARLRDRGHHDLLLVLAGQACNAGAEVNAAIRREKLGGAVRCLGYVPDNEVLPLYHGASLLALPSLHEGFGFPLLEAMACGVPVLAADNSALRELAVEPEMLCSGEAAAWAKKMERLLTNQNLRQRLAAYGRQRAQEFCWRKTAEATRQVYESLQAPRRYFVNGSFAKNSSRNGMSHNDKKELPVVHAENDFTVRDAVLQTVAYADLFDYPMRAEEICDGLFSCRASLPEVQSALQSWQHDGVIEQDDRLFFVRGRQPILAVREQRRQNTQQLLQKHARLLRLIVNFPFVRSVSLSGAPAFENCKNADDIDLFVLTAPRRLWSVYLSLVVLTKILGKRRTICLNCLLDLEHLNIAERDFFIAHQIAFLRPLSGVEYFQKFQAANGWTAQHLPQRRNGVFSKIKPWLATVREDSRLKKITEKIWARPIFDLLEKIIFINYRRRIRRKTAHLNSDGIIAQPGQIKLFTNNHRHRIKNALQNLVQKILQPDFLPEEVEERHVAF